MVAEATTPVDGFAYPDTDRYTPFMVHENLSQAIEGLSSRIIAIRDSL
jgi:hypothetical protein